MNSIKFDIFEIELMGEKHIYHFKWQYFILSFWPHALAYLWRNDFLPNTTIFLHIVLFIFFWISVSCVFEWKKTTVFNSCHAENAKLIVFVVVSSMGENVSRNVMIDGKLKLLLTRNKLGISMKSKWIATVCEFIVTYV